MAEHRSMSQRLIAFVDDRGEMWFKGDEWTPDRATLYDVVSKAVTPDSLREKYSNRQLVGGVTIGTVRFGSNDRNLSRDDISVEITE